MTEKGGSPQSQEVELALDRIDFRTVYEAEFGYVWHSLRRLGVAERDREDLAHDAFVVFYRRLGDYDPTRPLRPWLFGICFRVASDHRRRAQVQREIPRPAAEPIDERPASDAQLARKEAGQLVAQALDTLDMDQRAVFVMHEIDGHSVPEIAAALMVPINTLYSRLRLGRAEFARAVRRLMKTEAP